MNIETTARKLTAMLAASTLLFATDGIAWAQHAGGGGSAAGGGVHAGGGAAGGGVHGGPAGGFRGGAVGGVRGGPGFRGYGWRWAPGWGWWWWGWGSPLGVYLSVLPWYYSTLWWDGIPYYYANGDYYIWNDYVGQYEQVQPPPEVSQQAVGVPPGGTPMSEELFAYPKNGQSSEQQATDKSACRAWASGQVAGIPAAPHGAPGSAPGTPPGKPGAVPTPPVAPPTAAAQRQDYLRAEAACLEGRGYSVE